MITETDRLIMDWTLALHAGEFKKAREITERIQIMILSDPLINELWPGARLALDLESAIIGR